MQVVVLNLQITFMWLLDPTEQINRFLLSVLKLQEVDEAQFVGIRVGFLLGHRGQEVIVSNAELLVKNSVGALSAHFVCAAVDHWVVLKVLGETLNCVALVERNQLGSEERAELVQVLFTEMQVLAHEFGGIRMKEGIAPNLHVEVFALSQNGNRLVEELLVF